MITHDLDETLSRPMSLPAQESVAHQAIREVKIRAHAPAKRKQRVQSENVLENLRNGWVSEYEAPAGSKRPRTAPRKPAASRSLELIASELRLFFRSVAELLRELARSIVRGMREVLKTDGTGPALIGLFAVMIAIGGLVYIVLVDRIFAQGQPSASTTADSPATTAPVAATTLAPVTTENAPVAAAPTAVASDQPASALFSPAPQSVAAAPGFGGFVRLPADLTKSDGTSALGGPSPSADGGGVVGLDNSRTADTAARKAQDAPVHPATAGSSNAPVATPAPQTRIPVSGEPRIGESYARPGAGVRSLAAGGSARQIVAADARTLAALESAQRMTARAGSAGEVESTAVAAIVHGGQAVFEVRHVRATKGEACPARIVVTAATLAFVPDASCEAGAFTIPLASVRSVEAGPVNAQSVGSLSIEYSIPGKRGGKLRLRLVGSRAHGASASAAAVTPIRNVIVAAQQPAAR